jgi:hypothetical protein
MNHKRCLQKKERIMRFAYLTRDEVNQDLAARFAAEHDIELEIFAQFDALVERIFDAVLCDLDSFYADDREMNFGALVIGSKHKPVALHSYNLDDQERRFLYQSGVLTARSLRGALFSRLATAVRQRRGSHSVA